MSTRTALPVARRPSEWGDSEAGGVDAWLPLGPGGRRCYALDRTMTLGCDIAVPDHNPWERPVYS